MRFQRLGLLSFGPFSDLSLDLSGGAPGGLHLIYGANEAGKSTSLRGVSGLLFGIPHLSGDAHVHSLSDLKISAVLEGADGRRLEVTRLKRRKDTLVDATGAPLAEGSIAAFLGGLDERSFRSRFGLTQEDLEEGARALLGGSEEGLFAAGTAGAGVRQVLDQLEGELSALYRPRGQKYRLNRLLSALSDAERDARHAVRPPEKWLEQKGRYDEVVQKVRAAEQERAGVRAAHSRTTRLVSVHSEVSRWQELKGELGAYVDLPLLSEDAPEQRRRVEAELREAVLEERAHERELSLIREAEEALPKASSLAEVDDERLAHLQNQLGSELKARQDLPKREGKLEALTAEVDRILGALGRRGHDPEALLVPAPLERSIRALSTRHRALFQRAADLKARQVQLAREHASALSRSEDEGDAPLEPHVRDALRAALAQVRDAQALEARELELSLAEQDLLSRRESQLSALSLQGDLPQLSREHIGAIVEKLYQRQRELDERTQKLKASERELGKLKARLEVEVLQSDVPTESDLDEARVRRDAQFIQTSVESSPAHFAQLKEAIREVDHLADRLRREGERVRAREQLQSAVAELSELVSTDRAALELCTTEIKEHRAVYRGCFAFLKQPPHPRESSQVVDAVAEIHAHQAECERLRGQLQHVKLRLAQAREVVVPLLIEGSGLVEGRGLVEGQSSAAGDAAASLEAAPLAHLAQRLDERLTKARADEERASLSRARADELGQKCRAAEEDRRGADEELLAFQTEWGGKMAELGLSPEATPEDAQSYLSDVQVLETKLHEVRDLRRRVSGITRDSAAFQELFQSLCQRHAPELAQLDPIEGASLLASEVRGARQNAADRKRLLREREARRESKDQAARRRELLEGELDALVKAAGATAPDELARIEQRVLEAIRIKNELKDLEAALRDKAGGAAVTELVLEVSGQGYDVMLSGIDDLERREAELDEALLSLRREADSLGQGLDLYRSMDAARAQQRAESARSGVQSALREYVVAKTAKALLDAEIHRYAEAHQGPILKVAESYFQRLTLGRYSGLRVGLGERVLRTVRDGKDIEVEQLSRGTRAQLFLALRLASLKRHFETHEPIPLVFDDLMVDFDEDRATAAFEILGELAQGVQILYFTHLARDVLAADAAVPRGSLFQHTLTVA